MQSGHALAVACLGLEREGGPEIGLTSHRQRGRKACLVASSLGIGVVGEVADLSLSGEGCVSLMEGLGQDVHEQGVQVQKYMMPCGLLWWPRCCYSTIAYYLRVVSCYGIYSSRY